MRNDLAGNEPKTIWQSQPTEPSAMTLLLLHQKMRAFEAKTRRELLRNRALLPFTIGLALFGLFQLHHPLLRLIFAVTIVWAAAGQYFLSRGMGPAVLPGDAALATGLQFYRQQIESRRHLFRRVLPWSFGPLVLTIAGFLLPILWVEIRTQRLYPKGIPLLVLLAAWIVAFFIMRMQVQRDLQREIEELDALEKENRS